MNFEFHAVTDRGLARANNEDAAIFDADRQIAVLADGMGGYNAGEVASRMATELVLQQLADRLDRADSAPGAALLQRAFEDAIAAANQAIHEAACHDAELQGMGTTLVAAVFQPQSVVVAHLGDSRCYRLRRRALTQLTRDHSLLQEQLDAGLITPQQAALSGNRNLVTRALGIEDAVHPEIHEHTVLAGDLFLLCSDGLTEMVAPDEIAALLSSRRSLTQKAEALVALANTHGGRDNVTVLLVQAPTGAGARRDSGEGGSARRLISRWLNP